MEDALQKLMKESGASKYANIATSANRALDVLESYTRAPSFENRKNVLEAVQHALAHGNQKLISQAIVVLQKMVRDDRFHSKEIEKDQYQWMSYQVIGALDDSSSSSSLNEEQKQELLKVLLSLSCNPGWIMNGSLVVQGLNLCLNLHTTGNNGTKAAAQATSAQIISEYCKDLDKTSQEDKFNDAMGLFQFLGSKMEDIPKDSGESGSEIGLILQCLITLIATIPREIVANEHFQKLIPKLTSTLLNYIGHIEKQSNEKGGFWKKKNSEEIVLSEHQCKIVYSVVIELTKLLGSSPSLRPVLESLLHRVFTCSPTNQRLQMIKGLTELFSDVSQLTNLTVYNFGQVHEDPVALMALVMKCLEISYKDCPTTLVELLKCFHQLFATLNNLSMGYGINTIEKAHRIQSLTMSDEDEGSNDDARDEEGQESSPKRLQSDEEPDQKVDGPFPHKSREDSAEHRRKENPQEDETTSEIPKEAQEQDHLDKNPKDDESDNQSLASDATDGPEEGYEDEQSTLRLDAYVDEASQVEAEASVYRSGKIPKLLVDDQARAELKTNLCRLDSEPDNDAVNEVERENARIFIKKLKESLDHIISARGSVEIDNRIQEFASKFCHEFSTHSIENCGATSGRRVVILNADGVYLTCYSALHLNMQLSMAGFYSSDLKDEDNSIRLLSWESFMNNILASGLLIYVSPIWLSEVYDQVTEVDIFEFGWKLESGKMNGLRNLLVDLDGMNRTEKGAQLVCEYRRFRPDLQWSRNVEDDGEIKAWAGKLLARRILTSGWSPFLSLLHQALGPYLQLSNGGRSNGLAGLLAPSKKKSKVNFGDERLANGLECLRKALGLCQKLEMHDRCGQMLEPLTSLICPDLLNLPNEAREGQRRNLNNLLIVEEVLQDALEAGSQSIDCWKYIMRCVTYILYTSNGRGDLQIGASKMKNSSRKKDSTNPGDVNDLNLKFDSPEQGENTFSFSSFALPPGFDRETDHVENLSDILAHYTEVKERNTILTPEETTQANGLLLKRIDQLFDDAAKKLNLKALVGFLSELCFCSHKELLVVFPRKSGALSTKIKHQRQRQQKSQVFSSATANDSLLFHRISEVMLKCVKSGRPLLHIVKAWALVGQHLMEAACHKEGIIAQKAVQYIHDIVTVFLQNTSEFPYFHFNESLFKPFENLVCMDLCDMDTQDHIVSSICEFVEASTTEIGSGWRSLFGTLKAVHFPYTEAIQVTDAHWQAVLDVFEAFLATENPQVFANAALDYVTCLIHHIRGSEERQQLEELVSLKDVEKVHLPNDGSGENLTQSALGYIMQCHEILGRMYNMSCCPVFQGAHRVHLLDVPQVVDPVVPEMEVISFGDASQTLPHFPYSYAELQTSESLPTEDYDQLFAMSNNHRGLLRVWYLLLDGMTSAVINCPRSQQSLAADALFTIFGSLQNDNHSPDLLAFGLYCTNHLMLPMLQSWLRRSQRTFQGWLTSGANFKHCMGKTTELVLTWMVHPNRKSVENHIYLMFKQLLLILIECTVIPVETIARLGCSCFRHIITSQSQCFSRKEWNVLCLSLCRASQITLYPLHQIMSPFYAGSSNFYGDMGDVKVAARRDSSKRETHRLAQLAQQVLLLDQQRSELQSFPDNPDVEERSFLFLLNPPGLNQNGDGLSDASLIRVPLRALLTGLTAHHILLQMMGTLLLKGTNHIIPSLANLLLQSSIMTPMTPGDGSAKSFEEGHVSLPGNLPNLTSENVQMILCSLRFSHQSALEFDCRPGMKFLVQKVAQLSNAANLYKQAGASWCLMALTLFHLCLARLRDSEVTPKEIKRSLEQEHRNRNTSQFSAVQTGKVSKEGEADTLIIESVSTTNEFFVDLHNLFLDICELYVDIIVDKEGHHNKMDEMSKQQLYFLTVEPDDFQAVFKQSSRESISRKSSTPSGRQTPSSIMSDKSDSPKASGMNSSSPKRPFHFSDFTSQPIRPDSPNVSEDSDIQAHRLIKGGSMTSNANKEDGDVFFNEEEEVFRVTTQAEYDAMMSEFRFRKGKRSLPSTSSKDPLQSVGMLDDSERSTTSKGSQGRARRNPFMARASRRISNSDETDPEIASQQRSSLMADSEAQIKVWTELVQVFLHLSLELSESDFQKFLPLLFPGVKALTVHAQDDELKQNVAAFFQRVANIYGFDSDA
ncbi:hypothetical protein TCAL_00090 [Tigriopus californicus]|uniref:SEC7 domain-containing protein n=1 Tax=Tigriopus californicus TaxID=6832 RepID=A0A553PFT7_TIGCA|nr:hypothetical protein TCAL_00090 [Tigriopus californicus]